MFKKKRFYRSLSVFIISFLVLSVIVAGIMLQYIKQEKSQCYYIASNQSNIIKDSVDAALSRVYTLNTLIISYNGDTKFFDSVSSLIYNEVKENTGISLKNIAVAPNGIVEKVYPLDGNENLIGFNFMDEKMPGNREAIEAYMKGSMVITNPFKLIQGGFGMAGRLPVFINDVSGRKQFWGLVTVTIDFDELMQAIDMPSLSKMNTQYRLWYEDQDGKKIVLSETGHISRIPSTYTFDMKNITWNLDISPKKGWVNIDVLILVFLILVAFSILLSMLYSSHTKVKEVNLKLRHIANRDPLTLCFSRNYLNSVLINLEDGTWKNPNSKYSLMILDIDYFKSVNDTYGHGVGDIAIKKVANALLENVKHEDGDAVIRYGGDEFIVLYNSVTRERFISRIEHIVEDVKKISFDGYPDLKLTVSIGAVHYDEKENMTYYQQVRMADEKLYESKKLGRDRYTI